jgi:tagatose 1,6-diphosphate aldolase
MFIDPGKLLDGGLSLVLDQFMLADPIREHAPVYHFNMVNVDSGLVMGAINLRIGVSDRLVRYRGQIGYSVKPEFRGGHLAARSLGLLVPLAAQHQLNPLWITFDPDNIASRRTCEIAGAELVEIIDVPEDEEMYQRGIRQKCRYRLLTD